MSKILLPFALLTMFWAGVDFDTFMQHYEVRYLMWTLLYIAESIFFLFIFFDINPLQKNP